MPPTLTSWRGLGRELGAGREQRGEVVDLADLVHRQQAAEQSAVADVADERVRALFPVLGRQLADVECDDVATAGVIQGVDQAVADFAAGAGDQDGRTPTLPWGTRGVGRRHGRTIAAGSRAF